MLKVKKKENLKKHPKKEREREGGKERERDLETKTLVTLEGISIRLSADFLAETLQEKRDRNNKLKVLKEKKRKIKKTINWLGYHSELKERENFL